MIIILLGAPGVGKGTQAEKVSEEYGIPAIATGDIFRENIRNGTELGQKASAFIKSGQLVPDDVTIGLIQGRLAQADCENGFILDGFPRTIPQAEALNEIFSNSGRKLDGVINIVLPDAEIIDRLTGRRMCADCSKSYHVLFNPPEVEDVCGRCGGLLKQRDDDKESVVRERLHVYHEQTEPLVRYYKQTGLYYEVMSERELEDTSANMSKALEALSADCSGAQ